MQQLQHLCSTRSSSSTSTSAAAAAPAPVRVDPQQLQHLGAAATRSTSHLGLPHPLFTSLSLHRLSRLTSVFFKKKKTGDLQLLQHLYLSENLLTGMPISPRHIYEQILWAVMAYASVCGRRCSGATKRLPRMRAGERRRRHSGACVWRMRAYASGGAAAPHRGSTYARVRRRRHAAQALDTASPQRRSSDSLSENRE
jgi:hypothetical protein